MSSRSLEYATSEEVFHLCTKNLQKGVGKYHFQRFIGRGIIIFQNFPKSCPILSLPIQSIPTQMETQNFIMKKRAEEVRLPSDHKMKE